MKAVDYMTHYTNVVFYKELLGISPTVNLSWFITKAYFPNIYYKTERNYSAAEDTYNEIIDVYKQTVCNIWLQKRHYWSCCQQNGLQFMIKNATDAWCFSTCTFIFYRVDYRRSMDLNVSPVFSLLEVSLYC